MKHLMHACRFTFLRFRWEIIGSWIFSALLIAGYLAGWIAPEPFPFLRVRPGIAFHRIEFLMVLWITLRLMLSGPVFRAQGGWRVRPFGRTAVGIAPFAVLAAVVLPPVLLRAMVVQLEFSPGMTQWGHLLTGLVLPMAGYLLAGALVLRAGGALVPMREGGMGRKIVLTSVCMALLALWFMPRTGSYGGLFRDDDNRLSAMGSGNYGSGGQVLGIQELLPDDSEFVGDWMTVSPPVFRVREVLRFPVAEGMVMKRPGFKLEVKSVKPQQGLLGVDFSVATMDPEFLDDLWDGVMVLRYRENIYSLRPKRSDWKQRQRLLLLPGTKLHFCGMFDSPSSGTPRTMNWEELMEGMELIIYRQDKTLPKIEKLPQRKEPEKKENRPPGVAGLVEEIFDKMDHGPDRNLADEMELRGLALTHDAMPFILARHPWSDASWERVVKPYLLRHAADVDKSGLLGRMETEPRLGEILVSKGWKKDAMPLLRRFAEERLPLDVVSLSALAEEKDASLAVPLATIAAGLDKDVDILEPALITIPGFDWKAFVNEGWLRRKYEYRGLSNSQPFSYWAAREGNVSAFRHTAMRAARGAEVEKGQLASLVAGAEGDMISYLRENIDRMEFDAGTKQWSLAR